MGDASKSDEDSQSSPREKFKFTFDQDNKADTSADHHNETGEQGDDADGKAGIDIIKTAVPVTPPAKLSHMLAPETDQPASSQSPPKSEFPPKRADVAAAREMPVAADKTPEPASVQESGEPTEETLAGMIAGRRLDTPEAERTFLLTLSRDQRLKYADLLQAGDQLDFDREKHGLELDRLELEHERLLFEQRTQYRHNATIFATTALRTLLVTNGLGCLVLIAVWGYLSASPTAVFSAQAFLLSLSSMGLGAIAGALTSLCAYVTQFLLSSQNAGVVSRGFAVVFRVIAVSLALAGFCLFIAGLLLAGHGLKSI